MKSNVLVIAFALGLACVSTVASADVPPQELKISGMLRTPTCTITVVNNGVYDFQRISSSAIPTSGHYALPEKSMEWNVDCGSGRTFLVFDVVDNRESSASRMDSKSFGLGSVNGSGKIGYFTVEMRSARVDDQAVRVMQAQKDAASGGGAASTFLDKTLRHSWTDADGGGRVPIAGSSFSSELAVKPHLADSTVMNGKPGEAVQLDGQLTLSYSFGL